MQAGSGRYAYTLHKRKHALASVGLGIACSARAHLGASSGGRGSRVFLGCLPGGAVGLANMPMRKEYIPRIARGIVSGSS